MFEVLKKKMSEKELVTIFMPSLAALLRASEKQRGRQLLEKEVYAIRDSATVTMVSREKAEEMERKRGYKDINPENCWAEWQELRKKF